VRPGRLLALVVAAAIAPHAADAALCRTKGGALFVRDACKRKETAVVVPKGDQGPMGASPPRVRALDAGGRTIGFVNGNGNVVIQQGNVAVAVRTLGDRFPPTGGIFFETPDCTGARFLYPGYSTMYQGARVIGSTAYYGGEPVVEHTLASSLSGFFSQSDCTTAGGTFIAALGACCLPVTPPRLEADAPALEIDLGTFTPPFHLEIER
jgi:hypothetical protein